MPAGRSLACCTVVALMLMLMGGTPRAQVPDAATPGGVSPEPPVAPLPVLPDAAAFPIPPSPERPFGVEDGDRIFVDSFELDGVVERPEQGIVLDELRALIEAVRRESQGLDVVGEDGFTDDERAAVLGFFQRVVALREFDDFLYEDYNDLVTKLREDRIERNAGLTIGQLQQVADRVTSYYRDKGFILAQAFIPAQEVDGGQVRIEVIEGTLGNVLAQGQQRYDEKVLAAPFVDLIGAPVTNAGIESAILTLRDYPGLTPTAVFRPGELVGTSDLIISVQDEKPYDIALQLDNNGSRFTGERRASVEASWNNPTGAGDRLNMQVIQSYMPKKSRYYAFGYEYPLWPGTVAEVGYSRQDFDVGGEQSALNISGEQQQAHLRVRQSLLRSRFQNLRGHVGLEKSNSVLKRNKTPTNEDLLAYVSAGFDYDRIDTENSGIDVASVSMEYGLDGALGGMAADRVALRGTPPSRRGGKGKFASNDFWKLNARYTRLQNIEEDIDLLLRLEGQWSNSLLTSTSQYKLGGPNNVRAYPVSEFLRDTAVFASMEWFWRAPGFADADAFGGYKWGELLRLSLFADYAVGTVNQPGAGDVSNVDISGYGAGVHFELPGQFLARLQASHPISGTPPSDDRATHWWFDLRYTF